jgi:hypothetical protein
MNKKLLNTTYAKEGKQSKWVLILKYLWVNRKTVIKIAFWLSWVIKKIFAWFED